MEGDAGTSRLNPTIEDENADVPESETAPAPDTPDAPDTTDSPESTGTVDGAADNDGTATDATDDGRRPSRLGSGSVGLICVVLLLVAAAGITGGYFAARADANDTKIATADQAALQAAMECVAATQAPDTTAMTNAQSKILECSTGDFGVQAGLYSSVLAEAYQASNATVSVDELRSAVERHNDDGSVNVLVAVRVKISNAQAANQQVGYRLRATMAFDQGRYRIAKLDQVTS